MRGAAALQPALPPTPTTPMTPDSTLASASPRRRHTT
jgi:hypothetical protein